MTDALLALPAHLRKRLAHALDSGMSPLSLLLDSCQLRQESHACGPVLSQVLCDACCLELLPYFSGAVASDFEASFVAVLA